MFNKALFKLEWKSNYKILVIFLFDFDNVYNDHVSNV